MQWQIRHPMPSILRRHFLYIIVASFINLIVCTLTWWFISNSSPKLSFALILVIVGFEVNEKNTRDFQDILISCMQIVTSIENLCNKSLYSSFRQTDSKQTRQLSLSGSIHEIQSKHPLLSLKIIITILFTTFTTSVRRLSWWSCCIMASWSFMEV